MNGVDGGVLEQLKTILRRDLKLGPDAVIADDMPLVGGDMDLDSLDILLLVSSIEKQFGIKVPNEVVGRWVFQNVSTLAKFVQDNRQTLSTANASAANASAAGVDWLNRLPHGPEFRFITKVYEVRPGERASGLWNVAGDEAFFTGHFPGRPVVPGVLLIEALAQMAGLAAAGENAEPKPGVLAHADVRFEAPVLPPASIELRATVGRSIDSLRQCEVIASVAGHAVARGTVAIRFG